MASTVRSSTTTGGWVSVTLYCTRRRSIATIRRRYSSRPTRRSAPPSRLVMYETMSSACRVRIDSGSAEENAVSSLRASTARSARSTVSSSGRIGIRRRRSLLINLEGLRTLAGSGLLGAPAGEQRRHLGLQEFEERERLRQPASRVGRRPDCFDSGPGSRYPLVEYLLAPRDHFIPAVVPEYVVIAAQIGRAHV